MWHLCHNDNLVAVDVVLLDRLAENDLRRAIGISVGGVEGVDA